MPATLARRPQTDRPKRSKYRRRYRCRCTRPDKAIQVSLQVYVDSLTLVANAIRTPALFFARTNSSTPGRNGTLPEDGYSACLCNGKTSSTRMSIPKCSSVRVRRGRRSGGGGGGGACGPRGGRRGGACHECGRGKGGVRDFLLFRETVLHDHRYSMQPFPGNSTSDVVFDRRDSRQRAGTLSYRRRGPCRRPPQNVTLERRPSDRQRAVRVVAAWAAVVLLIRCAGMSCAWEVRVAMGLVWPIVPHLLPAPPAPPANRRPHLSPAPPAGAAAGRASRLCTRKHERPPHILPAGAHVATARYSVHQQGTKRHGLHVSIDYV
jgi:hypothetical protein